MATATLTKVGNSAAAFLPASLRKAASIEVGDSYKADSPRKGVVVLRFSTPKKASKLETWKRAQAQIQTIGASLPPWPANTSAEDLLQAGKEARAREFLSA